MNIAFVNQAIDTILPPYQSSVGGLYLRCGMLVSQIL
jgi:hypothetical protein